MKPSHRLDQPHGFVAQARLPSPLGPLTAVATAAGLAGLWFDGQRHHPGPLQVPQDAGQRWLREAKQVLARWFDGDEQALAGLALDPQGTAFQRAVWQALRGIARGRTVTYGELAARLGRPQAARAIGAAVGRNPISLLVPCHRVVGQAGALTGYAGGLDRKQWLLTHEATGVHLPTSAPRRAA
ncbi:MAG: methylated-DNA--[protein]-cysteine S-methyltransferase [Aquabacterium sp.]